MPEATEMSLRGHQLAAKKLIDASSQNKPQILDRPPHAAIQALLNHCPEESSGSWKQDFTGMGSSPIRIFGYLPPRSAKVVTTVVFYNYCSCN